MNYQVFSELEWLYPDSPETGGKDYISLEAARGTKAGCQILLGEIDRGAQISAGMEWRQGGLPQPEVFQLIDVNVEANTGKEIYTTLNYEDCKDFAVRQAPYRVFEALKPLEDGPAKEGRLALYVSFTIPAAASWAKATGELDITVGGERVGIPVELDIFKAIVPEIGKGKFGMINWLNYENIAVDHNVEIWSDGFWEMVAEYFRLLQHMRNTHIAIVGGEAVRDAGGRLIGFDFTHAEKMARLAFKEGFQYVVGSFVARWPVWSSEEYHLRWDDKVFVRSREGYVQLSLYLRQWNEIIERNGWRSKMCQALADEPQLCSEAEYRILSSICRKHLPGVPIIEAVETPNLGGALDVWVPKQETYEKLKEDFDCYKGLGETFWFYTCGYPAGKMMNRKIDAPVLVSRYLFWMGFGYGMTGFLHWGFNSHNKDVFESTCINLDGAILPPGDGHISYPGNGRPWSSLRLEAQRAGAEDFELLAQLAAYDRPLANRLCKQCCRSFSDFTADAGLFNRTRHKLLEAVSAK